MLGRGQHGARAAGTGWEATQGQSEEEPEFGLPGCSQSCAAQYSSHWPHVTTKMLA